MEDRQSSFEVVRQEYVYTQETPMLSLKGGRIYVNKYAINLFPDHQFIQIMVDRDRRELVIQPVKQGVKDSFRWCGGKRRQPRKLKCLPVFYEIYKQMGWDIDCRYRIQGREEETETERALYFALKDAVCFRKAGNQEYEEFPKEWQGSFGERKAEHKDEDYIARYDSDRTFSVELPMDQRNLQRMMETATYKEEKGADTGDNHKTDTEN